MDIEDEAYVSLPSISNELDSLNEIAKKNSADTSEELGSNPLSRKERSAMNIGSKLFGGAKYQATGADGSNIKPGDTSKITLSGITPSAITPTTHLVGQLKKFGMGDGTALSPLADSPTSDYGSNNFPSLLSDPGYVSLPPAISMDKLVKTPPTTSTTSMDVAKETESGELKEGDVNDDESMEVDGVRSEGARSEIKNTTSLLGEEKSKIDIIETSSYIHDEAISERIKSPENIFTEGSRRSKSPSSAPVSLLASSNILVHSESPGLIPTVGENIEIITEGTGAVDQQKHEGLLAKRKAGMSEGEHGPSSKNPRLSPEAMMASKKAIRVSTIVTSSGGRLSPRPSNRKKSHSPVHVDHSPSNTFSTTTTTITTNSMGASQIEPMSFQPTTLSLPLPMVSLAAANPSPAVQQLLYQLMLHQQHQLQQQAHQHATTPATAAAKPARVNFKDIQDMSKSDRPPPGTSKSELIDNQSRQSMEQLRPPGSPATRPAGSPVPVTSPLHPMHVDNLISPRGSRAASGSPMRSRSLSPHSPRHADNVPPSSSSSSSSSLEQRPLPIPGDRGSSRGVGGGRGEEAMTGEKQNALLKVSEAHLAILPDEDGDTPLHLAVIHENVSLTRYLIRLIKGVHSNLDIPNNMRQTPLHLAVITQQSDMVQILMEAGASVNYPDRKGNSAIHLAAGRKDVKVLKILAKATLPLPNFNGKNFAGLTVVHVATKEACIEVLKYLFQVGSNKNTPDSCSGRAPIHYAVEAENFILVNFLLENSCNVNALTFSGNTPLHIAAGRRLKEIVALLMAYGANPALANGEGDFPSDLPASLLMQRAKLNAH